MACIVCREELLEGCATSGCCFKKYCKLCGLDLNKENSKKYATCDSCSSQIVPIPSLLNEFKVILKRYATEVIEQFTTSIKCFENCLIIIEERKKFMEQNVESMKSHAKTQDAKDAVSDYHTAQKKVWQILVDDVDGRIVREKMLLEQVQKLSEPVPLRALVMLDHLKRREINEIQVPDYEPHYLWLHPYSWVFDGKWRVLPKEKIINKAEFMVRNSTEEYSIHFFEKEMLMKSKEKQISVLNNTGSDSVSYTRKGFVVSYSQHNMIFCDVYEDYILKRTFCIRSDSNHKFIYDDKLFVIDQGISVYDLSGNLVKSIDFGYDINRILCPSNGIVYLESNRSLVMFSPQTYETEIIPNVEETLREFTFTMDQFATAPSGIIIKKLRRFPTLDGVFTLY